jgi:hypothetical protein
LAIFSNNLQGFTKVSGKIDLEIAGFFRIFVFVGSGVDGSSTLRRVRILVDLMRKIVVCAVVRSLLHFVVMSLSIFASRKRASLELERIVVLVIGRVPLLMVHME